MLKWVSNNSILVERERQTSASPRVETMRRAVGASISIGPSVVEENGTLPPLLVLTSANSEENDDMENLPLTPIKSYVSHAMSTLSLEFPFSARLSSPSIDSGVGSSKSSLITNATKILESPFKTFDDTAILTYSPSTVSSSSNSSLMSKSYLNQLADLVNMVITLPCLTRFPLAVAQYGGLAFLVVYTIVLVLLGFPSLYLQHNLARLEQKGPVQLWASLVPLAGGLGTALASLSLLMSVQYSVMTSHSMVYLISSFYTPLPWTQCSSWWNADSNCQEQTHQHPVADFLTEVEVTLNITLPGKHVMEPAYQQFWSRHVLQHGDVGDQATLNTKLVWAVLGLWVIIAVIILGGSKAILTRVQASLMVLLVTLTVAFAIKLSTMPMISAVISSTMETTWSSLASTSCWQEAVLLCSLGANIHTGSAQAVASHSPSRRDHSLLLVVCLSVHLLVCSVWSVLTLALAGDITSLDTDLFPLAVIGQVLSQVPGGQAWCQAWYSLTTALGLLSTLSSLAGLLSYTQTRQKTSTRIILGLVVLLVCLVISFLCTFPTTPSILSLLTRWGIHFPSFLLATMITTTLSLTYGLSRATDRIAAQDGRKMNLFLLRYLQLTASLSPLVLAYLSLSFLPTTSTSSSLTSWSVSLGWVITMLILVQLLLGAIVAVIMAVKANSRAILSWRELLGCRSLRASREKLVDRSSLASSSYRNFERCDITMMTDLGTPSRLRPSGSGMSGLVNRRLSLSPRRPKYATD